MRFASVVALSLGFLAMGCGSPDVLPPLWLGRPGDALPASTASNVFWVRADVDGVPGPQVIVDTGAPIALLHVEAFNGAVPLGSGRVATLTLGDTTLWKVPTVGDHGNSLAPTGLPDGGLIGFSVFGQFEMGFNYRDARVVVGPAALPDGVEAPVVVPFSLEGGGEGPVSEGGDVIRFAASRVIVPAVVEGQAVTLLLDTGASWVGLRSAIYQALVADGRGQLNAQANLAMGSATTNITRLRSVALGGVEITDAPAASATSVDGLLTSLSAEVHHTVDGLLGAPYLRQFHVIVDYPNRVLRLNRFTDRSFILDDYRRVGFEIGASLNPAGNAFHVQQVYPGTDADRQGIRRSDVLVAIDGTLLSTLDLPTVDRMLRGAVGSTKSLQLAGRTLDVRVDELLPLP